jgi:hypothetical protein
MQTGWVHSHCFAKLNNWFSFTAATYSPAFWLSGKEKEKTKKNSVTSDNLRRRWWRQWRVVVWSPQSLTRREKNVEGNSHESRDRKKNGTDNQQSRPARKQIPREFKANQRPSLIRKFHYRTAITYTLTQRKRERERDVFFFCFFNDS